MNTTSTRLLHDPRKLCDAFFAVTKRWWGISLISKLMAVIVSTVGLLLFPSARVVPLAITVIYVLSEFASWRSDTFKNRAESVLRKLDFRNSFGWEISGKEMAELVQKCPPRLRRKIPPPNIEDKYFASVEEAGATRALENLQESAYWSDQLAQSMGNICLVTTIILVLGSVALLLYSVTYMQIPSALQSIGRVVIAALSLVLSIGLFRLTMGYYGFSKKSAQADQIVESLFKSGCDEIGALKAFHDYQVARATSPLIPSLLWKWKNKDLNQSWEAYRKRAPTECK
jgi:hypothetical protein